MAIDIDAIRKRMAQINGGSNRGGGNSFKRWKYEKAGEFHIRVLPFKNTDPGTPFPEKTVYYGISGDGKGMIVSPENVGERDPIKNFRIDLFKQAKEAATPAEADELKAMAKKVQAKTINCVAVVDRSQESTGPQLWSPNWTDTQALLSLFLTDAGDYTDVLNGCDLTLVVTQGKKRNQRTGEPLFEAKITADRKNSPAAKDDATLRTWMDSMPNIDEYYPVTSTEETQKRLQAWLDSADHSAESDGTARGGVSQKQSEPPAKVESKPTMTVNKATLEKKPAPKAPAPKKPLLQEVDDDLDAALGDLEQDA